MDDLRTFIAASLARPVPPEIAAMAEHVRAQHPQVRAVLAYGSCLRGVATSESLIDLYVLTQGFEGVSPNALSRWGCRLVPPNVYYAENEFEGRTYRAKYAVLPLPQFASWMNASNPYFWARFSQPSALVYHADEQSREDLVDAIAAALRRMYAHALALPPSPDPWATGFAATYGTELRAESAARADTLVTANESYYREAANLMRGTPPVNTKWPLRRAEGKFLSVLRLMKAAFTFSGGADYIAWKIERHSGQKVELSDWQRRHPILAGITLLPQLIRRGAVR
ncbi:MAG: hypothetical protein ACKVP5_09615 [Aestuariivirga sp.]